MSATILPFPAPAASEPRRYCWQCAVCGGQAFVLYQDGSIACDRCNVPQKDAAWFFPDDDRPRIK